MDVSAFQIPNTADIHLEFPTVGKLYSDAEKTLPVVITVFGPSSDEAVAYKRKMSREAQAVIAKKGLKGLSTLTNDVDESEVERLVAMTADIKNLEYKGSPVTKDNIAQLYRDPKMGWIRDQVREKLQSWEDFLG